MSQSETHRQLVVTAAEAIRGLHPSIHLTLDVQVTPGNPIPSLINGHRPDIEGLCIGTCHRRVIAEAKTDGDIANHRTLRQLDAFLQHLETMESGTGTLILAVNAWVADTARGFLEYNCRDRVSSRLEVKVFDGLDFWLLGFPGDKPWHLS